VTSTAAHSLTRRRNLTLAVHWLTARLLQRDETDKESTNTKQARRKCEPEQQAVRVHARSDLLTSEMQS
jgi:hypothetical protein